MPPTIFFSTNTGSNSYHAGCIRRVYAEITTPSFCSQFQIIVCITENPIEILQQLQVYREEIIFFYFGGRDEHFQGLIDASFRARFGSLFDYLTQLRYLDLVFLSYCSKRLFVQPLLQAGIETIVGTSHHLPQTQTTEFATLFCQHYLIYGETTGHAYEQAINGSDLLPGTQARQFAGLHGNAQLRLRRWWQWEFEPKPQIIGTPPTPEPRIIGEPTASTADLPPLPATLQPPMNPFPGTRPYLAREAAVFFGRENELSVLYNQLMTAQPPIILLYGQSGVGKSSLLKAGLWPRLSEQFTRLYLNGQKSPRLFEALRHHSKRSDQTTITKRQWTTWLTRQKHDLLLIIDQFETQLLSQKHADEDDLAQLMTTIHTLLHGLASSNRPRVIFSVREENLVQCKELLAQYHLDSQIQEFRLSPLHESGIRAMLHSFAPSSRLATHYNFTIENDVEERVIADLSQDQNSPMAPFLQAILVKLWEEVAKTKSRPLSLQHYQQLYDTGMILRDFFDARLAEVRRQLPPLFHYKKLVDLLATYTALAETSRKRPIKAQETTQRTITHLKNFYLLTEKAGGPTNKLYLGHKLLEAPITQQFYRFMKDYTWFERQRFELGFIIDQLKARPVQPPPAKQKNQQSTSRLLGWFNQKTELTRGLVTLFTLLILLTLLTSFTLLFLFTFRQLLQPTLQQAVASPSGSQPYTLTVPPTFIAPSAEPMINVASGQRSFSVELKRVSTLYGYGTLPLTYTNQRGSILAFSPDSTLLFAGGGDNTVEVWRVMGLQAQPSLLVPAPSIVLTSVTRQGGLLIYTTLDGSVGRLYLDDSGGLMPTQPNEPVELLRHKGPVTAIQLNNDAALLVTGGQDGVLYHYDMETGQLVTLRSEPTDPISAVAIHPNKQMIASAGTNQLIVLWDRTTATIADQLAGHSGRVNSLEFSQDGARLLAASSDGSVCIWQLATGTRDYCFVDRTIGVNVAHYSTDGTLIMLAKNDGFIEVWDAVSHRRLDKVEAHPVGVSDLAISADGRHLASAGWDSSIALWEISVSAVPPQ